MDPLTTDKQLGDRHLALLSGVSLLDNNLQQAAQ